MPAACCAPRCAADDPVLFLEHKRLYREPYNRSPHPGRGFHHPVRPRQHREAGPQPDRGHLRRAGAEGAAGRHAGGAAATRDARIEIIDLRTLAPYDWEAIRASVEKTSRVMVAHEDCLSWGYGAEIAARIADELFDRLDAPVRRVGALDTWVGYHPQLEAAILPQTETLAAEMERLLAY